VTRRRRVLGLAGAALLLCAALCGCAAISSRELPDTPIAVRYLDKAEANRRADNWSDAQYEAVRAIDPRIADPRRPVGSTDAVGNLEDIGEFLGGVLGLSRDRKEVVGHLALIDPQTGDVTPIRAALRGAAPQDWSPDGRKLLFSQPEGDGYQIWEYDRLENTAGPVTMGPVTHAQACYGPDGRIVLGIIDTLADPPRAYIALSGPGGRRPIRPITTGPMDHSPACAPDGSALVFVRQDRRGRESLWLRAPVATGESRQLGPGREPSFSRGGEWLAFSARVGHSWRIWRMRADGSGRARIGKHRSGRGLRDESNPTISPDERFVVYTSSEAPPREHLYVRRFDGSGDRILFADGDAEFPIW
jgi:hypothetical protein